MGEEKKQRLHETDGSSWKFSNFPKPGHLQLIGRYGEPAVCVTMVVQSSHHTVNIEGSEAQAVEHGR